MVDTSTEAVTKLMDGVTPGPWVVERDTLFGKDDGYTVDLFEFIPYDTNERHVEDAHFIVAARDLVPALLAERDALKAERDRFEAALARACLVGGTTYLIERATKAEADVERLKAERDEAIEGWHVIHPNITVQDAALVERVACAMWKSEADRAAPNVGRNRTPEMFKNELDVTRAKWIGLADAALRAITEDKA